MYITLVGVGKKVSPMYDRAVKINTTKIETMTFDNSSPQSLSLISFSG